MPTAGDRLGLSRCTGVISNFEMGPGRNKPGPGTIRASASAVLAGVGWPGRPARHVLAGVGGRVPAAGLSLP